MSSVHSGFYRKNLLNFLVVLSEFHILLLWFSVNWFHPKSHTIKNTIKYECFIDSVVCFVHLSLSCSRATVLFVSQCVAVAQHCILAWAEEQSAKKHTVPPHLQWLIIQAVQEFMSDFDPDGGWQVDTFLLGEVTEPQTSQDRTEQI